MAADDREELAQLQNLLVSAMGQSFDGSAPEAGPGDQAEEFAAGSPNSPADFNDANDGVALLQSILVHPELGEFREHLTALDQRCADLEQQLDQSTKLVKLLIPLISELLNRQSAELKQEFNTLLEPITERLKAIESGLETRELSIQITGLDPDP
ncbi:MAG: hypothetical protein WBA99_03590 [Nodosilinea sp.]